VQAVVIVIIIISGDESCYVLMYLLLLGPPVELYNASTWIYRPAQSADGANFQQAIDGADVSPGLQVSY